MATATLPRNPVDSMLTALERLEKSPEVRALARYLGAREDRQNSQCRHTYGRHEAFVPLSAQKSGDVHTHNLGDIGWLHLNRHGLRLIELQRVKSSVAWSGAKHPVQVGLQDDSRAVLATMDLSQIQRRIQMALNEIRRPSQQSVIQVRPGGVGTFTAV